MAGGRAGGRGQGANGTAQRRNGHTASINGAATGIAQEVGMAPNPLNEPSPTPPPASTPTENTDPNTTPRSECEASPATKRRRAELHDIVNIVIKAVHAPITPPPTFAPSCISGHHSPIDTATLKKAMLALVAAHFEYNCVDSKAYAKESTLLDQLVQVLGGDKSPETKAHIEASWAAGFSATAMKQYANHR